MRDTCRELGRLELQDKGWTDRLRHRGIYGRMEEWFDG